MVDLALAEELIATSREAALRRFERANARFRLLTRLAALLVVLIFTGMIVSLVRGALPAINAFGLSFITSSNWNPVTGKFGAFPAIYGTLITSALAMLVA